MPPERSNPPVVGPNLPQNGRRPGQIGYESPDLPAWAIRKRLDEVLSLVIPSGVQEAARRPYSSTSTTHVATDRIRNTVRLVSVKPRNVVRVLQWVEACGERVVSRVTGSDSYKSHCIRQDKGSGIRCGTDSRIPKVRCCKGIISPSHDQGLKSIRTAGP